MTGIGLAGVGRLGDQTPSKSMQTKVCRLYLCAMQYRNFQCTTDLYLIVTKMWISVFFRVEVKELLLLGAQE